VYQIRLNHFQQHFSSVGASSLLVLEGKHFGNWDTLNLNFHLIPWSEPSITPCQQWNFRVCRREHFGNNC